MEYCSPQCVCVSVIIGMCTHTRTQLLHQASFWKTRKHTPASTCIDRSGQACMFQDTHICMHAIFPEAHWSCVFAKQHKDGCTFHWSGTCALRVFPEIGTWKCLTPSNPSVCTLLLRWWDERSSGEDRDSVQEQLKTLSPARKYCGKSWTERKGRHISKMCVTCSKI